MSVHNVSFQEKIPSLRLRDKTQQDKELLMEYLLTFFDTKDVDVLRKRVKKMLQHYSSKPLTFKTTYTFNVAKLKEDFSRIEKWNDQGGLYEYHKGDWETVNLRSPFGDPKIDFARNHYRDYIDTNLLKQCPYLQEVLHFFKCPTYRVRLSKLKAGASIVPHVDTNTLRFHIPIVTHPDVIFHINDERVFMEAGELWFLDTSFKHAVENRSPVDRVHMLIDVEYNAWVRSLFPSSIPFEYVTTQTYRNAMNLRGVYHLLDIKTPEEAVGIFKYYFENLR